MRYVLLRAFVLSTIIASSAAHAEGMAPIGCKTRSALDQLIKTYNESRLHLHELIEQSPVGADGTRQCMQADFHSDKKPAVLESGVQFGERTVTIKQLVDVYGTRLGSSFHVLQLRDWFLATFD